MAKLVSKTYGEALFEVAVEEGTIDSLMEETEAVLAIFQENEEYVKLLNHPKITVEEKVSMLKEAFAGKVSDQLTGLLTTVVEKGRFGKSLLPVLRGEQEQVREYKKIGTAVVTSAVSLTQDEKDSIEDKLLKTTSYKSFRMQYSVDESLIGGIIIQIGDRVVDSSIRTKLANMAKDLSKIQLAK